MIKKILFAIIAYSLLWIFHISYAIQAILPKEWNEKDYKTPWQASGAYSYLSVIELVNKYLWIAVWFFCFLFMVYNWYKLIANSWDSKETSKATKALIGSFIWIVICMAAYAIVKLTVGLFQN